MQIYRITRKLKRSVNSKPYLQTFNGYPLFKQDFQGIFLTSPSKSKLDSFNPGKPKLYFRRHKAYFKNIIAEVTKSTELRIIKRAIASTLENFFL